MQLKNKGEKMVNVEFSEGISETLDILNHLDKVYTDKIPEKFKNFLDKNKSSSYIPKLDHSKKINEMNLKESTKDILTTIYIKYWATAEERSKYTKLLIENEKKYQEELRKKYNIDDLFKNKKTKVETVENAVAMIEYKKSILTKIKSWFKRIFLINKIM